MLVFQRDVNGVRYEVRTAGASRRLYTNGAFHSQYNPNFLFTGAVWDLLSLPSLFMSELPKRVLVLGVGGGTVIHQLHQLHRLEQVTGVELDPNHIDIAREQFDLNYAHTKLIEADGSEWLKHATGQFDYIVDDIFQHTSGDPARPLAANQTWFNLLKARLTPTGTIVQNHISRRDAKQAATFAGSHYVKLSFENEGFENCVISYFARDQQTSATATRLLNTGAARLTRLSRTETRRLRVKYRPFM